jgi:hypothetical protein
LGLFYNKINSHKHIIFLTHFLPLCGFFHMAAAFQLVSAFHRNGVRDETPETPETLPFDNELLTTPFWNTVQRLETLTANCHHIAW